MMLFRTHLKQNVPEAEVSIRHSEQTILVSHILSISSGKEINPKATFRAGCRHIVHNPTVMNDVIRSAPHAQSSPSRKRYRYDMRVIRPRNWSLVNFPHDRNPPGMPIVSVVARPVTGPIPYRPSNALSRSTLRRRSSVLLPSE